MPQLAARPGPVPRRRARHRAARPTTSSSASTRWRRRAPAGSNGVIFTPWLNGERTPVDDHTVRAGWHNLSLATTAGRPGARRARGRGVQQPLAARRGREVRAAGRSTGSTSSAAARSSALWCQIHADVMDREIRQVEHPIRANARGAALLAALALGHSTVEEISRQGRDHRDVHAAPRRTAPSTTSCSASSARSTSRTRRCTAGSTPTREEGRRTSRRRRVGRAAGRGWRARGSRSRHPSGRSAGASTGVTDRALNSGWGWMPMARSPTSNAAMGQ